MGLPPGLHPQHGWPARGSSPGPWARPASAAGWRPCWPGGRPAGGSISGGSGYAGRARIAVRSGGTYVVGVRVMGGSKTAAAHRCRRHRRPPKKIQREEDPGTAEEDRFTQRGGRRPSRRRPTFSNRLIHCTFRTAMTSTALSIMHSVVACGDGASLLPRTALKSRIPGATSATGQSDPTFCH